MITTSRSDEQCTSWKITLSHLDAAQRHRHRSTHTRANGLLGPAVPQTRLSAHAWCSAAKRPVPAFQGVAPPTGWPEAVRSVRANRAGVAAYLLVSSVFLGGPSGG